MRILDKEVTLFTTKDVATFTKEQSGMISCPAGYYEAGTVFPECCVINKGAILGPGCKIGAYSAIRDSKIGDCCEIGRGSYIYGGVIIGNQCVFDEHCMFTLFIYESVKIGWGCKVEKEHTLIEMLNLLFNQEYLDITLFYLCMKPNGELYVLVRNGQFLGDLNKFEKRVKEQMECAQNIRNAHDRKDLMGYLDQLQQAIQEAKKALWTKQQEQYFFPDIEDYNHIAI